VPVISRSEVTHKEKRSAAGDRGPGPAVVCPGVLLGACRSLARK
jgi:hypothetical protein